MTAKERKEEIRKALITILKTNEKFLGTRLVGIGLGDTCTRCGGCGEYSFNLTDGTRCFGCGGLGKTMPKMTVALLESVKEKVEAGELDRYLETLRARKVAKSGPERVMKAWTDTGISKKYKWQNAYATSPTFNPEDLRISKINKVMCDAYKRVCDICDKSINLRGTELDAKVIEINIEIDKALEEISRAAENI